MSVHNEPIPLSNVIEILEVYIQVLEESSEEDVDAMRHVLIWSLNYLRTYKDCIDSIAPKIAL